MSGDKMTSGDGTGPFLGAAMMMLMMLIFILAMVVHNGW